MAYDFATQRSGEGNDAQARAGISTYIDFYNSRRPHRAHGGRTPDVVYFAALPGTERAA